MNPLTLAVIGLYLLCVFACWMAFQLLRQNGRILVRLEALEARVAAAADAGTDGLPPGTAAPPFELPTIDGATVCLQQFRGQRVVIVFFDPRCGFCQQMAPEIADMQRAEGIAARPALLLVTTGDTEGNRRLFARHRIEATVAVQRQTEVMARYRARGTPTGYLIDESGTIVSDLTIGSRALLELARTPGGSYRGNRPLSTSKIARDGLPAGTAAPPFQLPRIGGGEIRLADYRGRKVLLVFSDPHCGPCQQLAPKLEQLHRERRDVAVVMVSRGDETENREKVAEHGLTFPVGLQGHWEVSRAYGMFATPIAFLIDENGVIARNVTVGPDAILSVIDAVPVAR